MAQTIPGPAIIRGHYYAPLRIAVSGATGAIFPAGCELRAQLRSTVASEDVITELTTQNGGLKRIDDNTIEMFLSPEETARATDKFVFLDFVRTDTNPDLYLYIQMVIPVETAVTRGGQR